ncbi:MAG: GGDEF domain-containing protein [Campylobacterota bacterium]|nr:GGDEF domain-containing protein [Campylobacterota bacterium]
MKTNVKFTLILIIMLTALLVATLLNVAFNFRANSLESATEKAKMTASIVRDSLTAHMVNGSMDNRQYFLDRMTHNNYVDKLWIVRAPAVNEQYGEGFKNEVIRDAIDKQVISSGETVEEIYESSKGVHLRVSIPYIASADDTNCLSCHNVPLNTVLGAISMEFDISDTRDSGSITLLKILALNIVFIVIAILITNHYLKPFIRHFETLKEGVDKAYRGDFSYRFETSLQGEGAVVTERLNHLFSKMEETFGQIKTNLTTFLTQSKLSHEDPLQEAQIIIKELADVYKFKKTIELDRDKNDIYNRLVHIISEKFEIKSFTIFEINKDHLTRELIHTTDEDRLCTIPMEDLNECRAYRTDSDVVSSDFPNLCDNCNAKKLEYICIPFAINDSIVLSITLFANDLESLGKLHADTNSIKNYLEAAKPVIESRVLMNQLRDSSLRDGMTKLYNRRFLEEFIDKVMSQTIRDKGTYSVLMLDIDFFKLVNDNYGHDAGDIVIKGLADILTSNIRAADLAIRYGGEEFTILLHNATNEGAINIANKIQEQFNETKFNVGTETIQKTISIGIASFPNDADSIWKVIKYADTALYEAKNTGRNKVVTFTEEMFSYEESKS